GEVEVTDAEAEMDREAKTDLVDRKHVVRSADLCVQRQEGDRVAADDVAETSAEEEPGAEGEVVAEVNAVLAELETVIDLGCGGSGVGHVGVSLDHGTVSIDADRLDGGIAARIAELLPAVVHHVGRESERDPVALEGAAAARGVRVDGAEAVFAVARRALIIRRA